MLFFIWTLLAFANEDVSGRKCHGHDKEEWSYDNQTGWAVKYSACNGTRQSPIDIDTSKVEEDKTLSYLTFINYDKPLSGNLTNNGHTAQLTVTDGVAREVRGNGLPKGCKFIQCHFHWGRTRTRGSEHRINGRRFPMEVHMVHRCEGNQLAVLGTFFEQQTAPNPGLGGFVKPLKSIRHKGNQTVVNQFDLEELLPDHRGDFFRYNGSLTTPACDEVVTWTVFGEAVPIGEAQIHEFRSLYSTEKSEEQQCKLHNNYRNTQRLNDRKVTSLREDYKR